MRFPVTTVTAVIHGNVQPSMTASLFKYNILVCKEMSSCFFGCVFQSGIAEASVLGLKRSTRCVLVCIHKSKITYEFDCVSLITWGNSSLWHPV